MAIYPVEDQYGRLIEFEGDSPPTDQELEEIFASLGEPEKEAPPPEQPPLQIGEPLAEQAQPEPAAPKIVNPFIASTPDMGRAAYLNRSGPEEAQASLNRYGEMSRPLVQGEGLEMVKKAMGPMPVLPEDTGLAVQEARQGLTPQKEDIGIPEDRALLQEPRTGFEPYYGKVPSPGAIGLETIEAPLLKTNIGKGEEQKEGAPLEEKKPKAEAPEEFLREFFPDLDRGPAKLAMKDIEYKPDPDLISVITGSLKNQAASMTTSLGGAPARSAMQAGLMGLGGPEGAPIFPENLETAAKLKENGQTISDQAGALAKKISDMVTPEEKQAALDMQEVIMHPTKHGKGKLVEAVAANVLSNLPQTLASLTDAGFVINYALMGGAARQRAQKMGIKDVDILDNLELSSGVIGSLVETMTDRAVMGVGKTIIPGLEGAKMAVKASIKNRLGQKIAGSTIDLLKAAGFEGGEEFIQGITDDKILGFALAAQGKRFKDKGDTEGYKAIEASIKELSQQGGWDQRFTDFVMGATAGAGTVGGMKALDAVVSNFLPSMKDARDQADFADMMGVGEYLLNRDKKEQVKARAAAIAEITRKKEKQAKAEEAAAAAPAPTGPTLAPFEEVPPGAPPLAAPAAEEAAPPAPPPAPQEDANTIINLVVKEQRNEKRITIDDMVADAMEKIQKTLPAGQPVDDAVYQAVRAGVDAGASNSVSGLPGNAHLNQAINTYRVVPKGHTNVSLAMDLDFFKRYNDTYGHPTGDEFLKQTLNVIAQRIKALGLQHFHQGGDEHSALGQVRNDQVAGLAQQLVEMKKYLDEIKIVLPNGNTVPLSMTLGLSANEDVHKAVANADKALIEQKQKRRNSFIIDNSTELAYNTGKGIDGIDLEGVYTAAGLKPTSREVTGGKTAGPVRGQGQEGSGPSAIAEGEDAGIPPDQAPPDEAGKVAPEKPAYQPPWKMSKAEFAAAEKVYKSTPALFASYFKDDSPENNFSEKWITERNDLEDKLSEETEAADAQGRPVKSKRPPTNLHRSMVEKAVAENMGVDPTVLKKDYQDIYSKTKEGVKESRQAQTKQNKTYGGPVIRIKREGDIHRVLGRDQKVHEARVKDNIYDLVDTEAEGRDAIRGIVSSSPKKTDKIFVVTAKDPATKKVDYYTAMVGYADIGEAEKGFKGNYPRNANPFSAIFEFPNKGEFLKWATTGRRDYPLSDKGYNPIKRPDYKPGEENFTMTQEELAAAGYILPTGKARYIRVKAEDIPKWIEAKMRVLDWQGSVEQRNDAIFRYGIPLLRVIDDSLVRQSVELAQAKNDEEFGDRGAKGFDFLDYRSQMLVDEQYEKLKKEFNRNMAVMDFLRTQSPKLLMSVGMFDLRSYVKDADLMGFAREFHKMKGNEELTENLDIRRKSDRQSRPSSIDTGIGAILASSAEEDMDLVGTNEEDYDQLEQDEYEGIVAEAMEFYFSKAYLKPPSKRDLIMKEVASTIGPEFDKMPHDYATLKNAYQAVEKLKQKKMAEDDKVSREEKKADFSKRVEELQEQKRELTPDEQQELDDYKKRLKDLLDEGDLDEGQRPGIPFSIAQKPGKGKAVVAPAVGRKPTRAPREKSPEYYEERVASLRELLNADNRLQFEFTEDNLYHVELDESSKAAFDAAAIAFPGMEAIPFWFRASGRYGAPLLQGLEHRGAIYINMAEIQDPQPTIVAHEVFHVAQMTNNKAYRDLIGSFIRNLTTAGMTELKIRSTVARMADPKLKEVEALTSAVREMTAEYFQREINNREFWKELWDTSPMSVRKILATIVRTLDKLIKVAVQHKFNYAWIADLKQMRKDFASFMVASMENRQLQEAGKTTEMLDRMEDAGLLARPPTGPAFSTGKTAEQILAEQAEQTSFLSQEEPKKKQGILEILAQRAELENNDPHLAMQRSIDKYKKSDKKLRDIQSLSYEISGAARNAEEPESDAIEANAESLNGAAEYAKGEVNVHGQTKVPQGAVGSARAKADALIYQVNVLLKKAGRIKPKRTTEDSLADLKKRLDKLSIGTEATVPAGQLDIFADKAPTTTGSEYEPNRVYIQVRNARGAQVEILTAPHDGTIKGMKTAARELQRQLEPRSVDDYSMVQSRIGATDAAGNPTWVIAPNQSRVAKVGTPEAANILGLDLERPENKRLIKAQTVTTPDLIEEGMKWNDMTREQQQAERTTDAATFIEEGLARIAAQADDVSSKDRDKFWNEIDELYIDAARALNSGQAGEVIERANREAGKKGMDKWVENYKRIMKGELENLKYGGPRIYRSRMGESHEDELWKWEGLIRSKFGSVSLQKIISAADAAQMDNGEYLKYLEATNKQPQTHAPILPPIPETKAQAAEKEADTKAGESADAVAARSRAEAPQQGQVDLFGQPVNDVAEAIQRHEREKAEREALMAADPSDLPIFNNNEKARAEDAQQSMFSLADQLATLLSDDFKVPPLPDHLASKPKDDPARVAAALHMAKMVAAKVLEKQFYYTFGETGFVSRTNKSEAELSGGKPWRHTYLNTKGFPGGHEYYNYDEATNVIARDLLETKSLLDKENQAVRVRFSLGSVKTKGPRAGVAPKAGTEALGNAPTKSEKESLVGSTWHGAAKISAKVRNGLAANIHGKPTPLYIDSKGKEYGQHIKNLLLEHGTEGLWHYLDNSEHGFIGHPQKPMNAVNGSFLDCRPSKKCSGVCYACKGRSTAPEPMIKGEVVAMAIGLDPRRAAEMIARQYRGLGHYNALIALRFFDKGDIGPGYVEMFKHLAEQGIRAHIFSKKPNELSKVDPRHIRLLSIDNSNAKVAEGNNLQIAFMYESQSDVPLLEKFGDRIQVVLPLKRGAALTPQADRDAIPDRFKNNNCPVDMGQKTLKEWDCTNCDAGKGLGCYFNQATHEVFATQPVTRSKVDQAIKEIRNAANAKGLPAKDKASILEALSAITKVLPAGSFTLGRLDGPKASRKPDPKRQGYADQDELEVGELPGSKPQFSLGAWTEGSKEEIYAHIQKPITIPYFYSNAEKAIRDIKQDKALGEQWWGMLKPEAGNGTKKEENDWLGLEPWLNERKGKIVTRAELQNFVAEKKLTVQAVELRPGGIRETDISAPSNPLEHLITRLVQEEADKEIAAQVERMVEYGGHSEDEIDMVDISNNLDYTIMEGRVLDNIQGILSTSFDDYVVDANKKNYREQLVTIPMPMLPNPGYDLMVGSDLKDEKGQPLKTRRAVRTPGGKILPIDDDDLANELLYSGRTWGGPHFTGSITKNNVLIGHMRTTDRVVVGSGDPWTRFIEEMQSDLQQLARKMGVMPAGGKAGEKMERLKNEAFRSGKKLEKYKVEKKSWAHGVANAFGDATENNEWTYMAVRAADPMQELERVTDRVIKAWPGLIPQPVTSREEVREELKLYLDYALANRAYYEAGEAVPDVPWKNNWPKLLARAAVMDAISDGMKSIAWTKGQTQYDRWGSELFQWEKRGDGTKAIIWKAQHSGQAGAIDLERQAQNNSSFNFSGRMELKPGESIDPIRAREIVEGTMSAEHRRHYSQANWNSFIDRLTKKFIDGVNTQDKGDIMPRKEGLEYEYDKVVKDEMAAILNPFGGKIAEEKIYKGDTMKWTWEGPEYTSEEIKDIIDYINLSDQIAIADNIEVKNDSQRALDSIPNEAKHKAMYHFYRTRTATGDLWVIDKARANVRSVLGYMRSMLSRGMRMRELPFAAPGTPYSKTVAEILGGKIIEEVSDSFETVWFAKLPDSMIATVKESLKSGGAMPQYSLATETGIRPMDAATFSEERNPFTRMADWTEGKDNKNIQASRRIVDKAMAMARDHVREYLDEIVDRNTVFVAQPSTTGNNTIPVALAEALGRMYSLPSLSGNLVARPNRNEQAKNVPEPERPFTQIPYQLTENAPKALAGKRIILVDDILTTHGSVANMDRVLSANGYQVVGFVGLAGTEQVYPAPTDPIIKELQDKILVRVGMENETPGRLLTKTELQIILNHYGTLENDIARDQWAGRVSRLLEERALGNIRQYPSVGPLTPAAPSAEDYGSLRLRRQPGRSFRLTGEQLDLFEPKEALLTPREAQDAEDAAEGPLFSLAQPKFQPEQIKSALANTGKFSKTKPDIRFSLAAPLPAEVDRRPAPLYKETDSPEFKAWFGTGIIKHKNGRPRMVFHGTNKDFDTFWTRVSEMGAHVGTERQAIERAKTHGSMHETRIIPLYTNISNPLRLTDLGDFDIRTTLDQLQEKGIITEKEKEQLRSADLSQPAIQDKLKSLGYDSIVYLNRRENIEWVKNKLTFSTINAMDDEQFKVVFPEAEDSHIIFEPEQLKHAWENTGAFSRNNPNIYFSLANEGEWRQTAGELGREESPTVMDELYKRNAALAGKKHKPIKEIPPEGSVFQKVIVPISEQLEKVAPTLKVRLRRYERDRLRFRGEMLQMVAPFLRKKAKALTKDELANYDLAEKNGWLDYIDAINSKYDLAKEYAAKRAALDRIWDEATRAGFDMGFWEQYAPRSTSDLAGLMKFIYGGENPVLAEAIAAKEQAIYDRADARQMELQAMYEERIRKVIDDTSVKVAGLKAELMAIIQQQAGPKIQQTIRNVDIESEKFRENLAAEEQGIKDKIAKAEESMNQRLLDLKAALAEKLQEQASRKRPLTDAERWKIANTLMRGYRTAGLRIPSPGFTEERAIDIINPEMNVYYDHSDAALVKYITGMTEAIELRKLFGQFAVMKDEQLDLPESIGQVVVDMMDRGELKAEDEVRVKYLLNSFLNPAKIGYAANLFRTVEYIETLGHIHSAITQLQDQSFAVALSGPMSYLKAIATKNRILGKGERVDVLRDFYIENIAHEFTNPSRSSAVLEKVLMAAGLSRMDRLAKDILINGAWLKYQAMSKTDNGRKLLRKEMVGQIEASKIEATIQGLQAGELTDDVMFLLFNTIMDFHPISALELPPAYSTGGNWRVAYMLKTYTIKQLSIYRRYLFAGLKGPDKELRRRYFRMLVGFIGGTIALGMTADAIKDLISGRPIRITDLVMDNIMKVFGVTKYQAVQFKQAAGKGEMAAAVTRVVMPPFRLLESTGKDVFRGVGAATTKGKIYPVRDFSVWQSVPLVGKLYYWNLGGGRIKTMKSTIRLDYGNANKEGTIAWKVASGRANLRQEALWDNYNEVASKKKPGSTNGIITDLKERRAELLKDMKEDPYLAERYAKVIYKLDLAIMKHKTNLVAKWKDME